MKRRGSRRVLRTSLTVHDLRALVGPVAHMFGVRGAASAEVVFLPNRALQRLKWRHLRRRASFVNVLAFPEPSGFPHPEAPRGSLGEIYLNEAYRRDPDEGLRMFIHGLAHLCGFNHDGRRDTMEMQAAERRALTRARAQRGTRSPSTRGVVYEDTYRT
jgi:ssRNA-specific RNase YbeY (16S rRNA maturation enzyme)